jgi:hypothetical protein
MMAVTSISEWRYYFAQSSLDSVMTKNKRRLGLILTSSSKLPLDVSSLRLRILIMLVQQSLSTPESTR